MRRSAIFRLIWLVIAHTTVHLWHTRRAARGRTRSLVLGAHVLAGFFETAHFALTDLHSDPLPDALDVVACLVQSGTNALLVNRMTRGLPILTPASYLAGAILRPVLTIGAYSYASHLPSPAVSWHRISISTVDGFIWTRIFILLLRYSPIPIPKYSVRYALAVFAAGCLGFLLGGGDDGAGAGVRWMAAYITLAGTLAVGMFATQTALRPGWHPSNPVNRAASCALDKSGEAQAQAQVQAADTPALSRSSSGMSLHLPLEQVITPSESSLDLAVVWNDALDPPFDGKRAVKVDDAGD